MGDIGKQYSGNSVCNWFSYRFVRRYFSSYCNNGRWRIYCAMRGNSIKQCPGDFTQTNSYEAYFPRVGDSIFLNFPTRI